MFVQVAATRALCFRCAGEARAVAALRRHRVGDVERPITPSTRHQGWLLYRGRAKRPLVLLAEVVADVRLEGRVEERVVLGPHAGQEEDRREEHGDERDRRPETNLVVADLLELVVLRGR